MKFQLLKRIKFADEWSESEWQFLLIRTKNFKFDWFTDYGEWFIYITIGKRYWRFSSAGYMKGKRK